MIAHSLYPYKIGGVETHVYYLSKSLNNRGINVELLTKDGKFSLSDSGKKHNLSRLSTLGKLNHLREDFDVVHMHAIMPYGIFPLWIFESEIIPLLVKLCRKKVVCTPHGGIDNTLRKSSKSLKHSIYLCFLRSSLFRLIDRFIAIYSQQKDIFKCAGIPEEMITFIPNGIPEENFCQTDPQIFKKKHNLEDRKIITFFGTLRPHKRIEDLIGIMPEILQKDRAAVLIIAGEDRGSLNTIQKLIRKHNIDDNVLLLGRINETDKHLLLSSTDIFVNPSSYEGFGLSMAETMAHGVAVISADNPGAKYVLEGNCGLLYKMGDQEQLRRKVLFLLDNEEARKKLAERGKNRAREFEWKKVAKSVEEVYRELINQS